MLQQGTPFSWHFVGDDVHGLNIRRSIYGEYVLCRQSQIGPRCYQNRTLSTHQTLEEAISAADAHKSLTP